MNLSVSAGLPTHMVGGRGDVVGFATSLPTALLKCAWPMPC